MTPCQAGIRGEGRARSKHFVKICFTNAAAPLGVERDYEALVSIKAGKRRPGARDISSPSVPAFCSVPPDCPRSHQLCWVAGTGDWAGRAGDRDPCKRKQSAVCLMHSLLPHSRMNNISSSCRKRLLSKYSYLLQSRAGTPPLLTVPCLFILCLSSLISLKNKDPPRFDLRSKGSR